MRKFFYVSCIEGSRKALVAGPYASHEDALNAVYRVKLAASKVDDRSWFYAWGTAGSDDEYKTVLGVL